ncbi:hypothetical protein LIER_13073 [Lithospermum erythrorhizon]|uniref:MULE transposase domain-containing protein n=1 Tax=Lithospermum erythrorhizon TaxID=34254 RepID=A0AAV3PXB2_LITER
MFVTHPSRKLAKSLLLGEIYNSIRSNWPKATLKELDDEEAKSLEENVEGRQRIEDVKVQGGQRFEEMEVQGDEERMFEDLGPILNDIGPIPECSFEHSNQLVELSEEETEGEADVGFSLRRQKKKSGGLEYSSEAHLKNPVLVPNMVFGSAADFRQLVRERFVCLDGCFLKGAFKGQILAVVALDADNGIYPIAWVVVEVQNTDSWTWFMRLLKEDLMMDREPDSWILMTDQQKGLEIAIKNELPDAEHRLCVKHLQANWGKDFQGKP